MRMHAVGQKNRLQEQRGISLVMVLVILSGVMTLGLVASNLVLREAVSVKGIEESEVAFFAAEAGAERRLYEYNKKLPGRDAAVEFTDSCSALVNTMEVIQEARWKEIGLSLITEPNPWTVSLTGGNTTFELLLDLEGVSYPSRLQIQRLAGGNAEVTVLQQDKVTGTESQWVQSGDPAFVPGPGASDNFDFANYYYRIKISESGGGSSYQINMIGGSSLVTGMVITTCGEYKKGNFQRQVEVRHFKWNIF